MANVERGATITKEIRNTLSNRKHAATSGSACMHWRKCVFVCLCVYVHACVCARGHARVRTCVRAYVRDASATSNVGWRRPAERTHA